MIEGFTSHTYSFWTTFALLQWSILIWVPDKSKATMRIRTVIYIWLLISNFLKWILIILIKQFLRE
jgi:hypothetical protein